MPEEERKSIRTEHGQEGVALSLEIAKLLLHFLELGDELEPAAEHCFRPGATIRLPDTFQRPIAAQMHLARGKCTNKHQPLLPCADKQGARGWRGRVPSSCAALPCAAARGIYMVLFSEAEIRTEG